MAALADNVGLLFRIKTDSSDAIRDMNRVQSEVKTTGVAAQAAGGGFTSMASSVSLATVAVTAITTGLAVAVAVAVKVTTGLYDLAKTASEAGSELKDMQDKTGLAAVTLSTLKLNADSAGSSLEQVGGGVEKFAKLLGQAADGSEKAQKTLKDLGVDTTNLDAGLRQVIKSIAAANEGTEQITLAQKAFGKSGADLIPVIKQMDGDLEKAEKAAKKLGLTLTDADIKAADEFGDTLTTLTGQLKSLASQFALQYAPIITNAMNSIVASLARNQDAIRAAGQNFANVLRGMQSVASSATVGMIGSFAAWAAKIISYIDPVQNAIFLTIRALGLLGQNAPKGAGTAQEGGGFVASSSGIPSISPSGGGGKGGGGAASVEDPNRKAIQDLQASNARALSAYQALLDAQESELKQSLNLRLIDEVKYTKAVAELQLKALIFEQTQNEKLLKDERLNDEERVEAENKKLILIRKVAKARIDIANDVFETIKKITEKETKDFEEKEERRREAARKTANERAKTELSQSEKEQIRQANDANLSILGDSVLSIRNEAGNLENTFTPMLSVFQMMGGMVQSLAQGFGSLVQQMVLTGTAGPNALKKLVASVLAGVAAQAAVLAIMELAYGIAALTPWGAAIYGPAPFHFKAAALFGSIAVATGLAGRAVAGDSFNQQTANGGSGGNGGGSGGEAAGQPERLNFTERFNGFQQQLTDQMARVMQRTNEVLGGVTEAVDTFNQKFGITTPGAVVMAGAGDAGEAIFGAVTGHLDSDLRAGSNFIRSQGKME